MKSSTGTLSQFNINADEVINDLAERIHETKGPFFFFLGSGTSFESGIPTTKDFLHYFSEVYHRIVTDENFPELKNGWPAIVQTIKDANPLAGPPRALVIENIHTEKDRVEEYRNICANLGNPCVIICVDRISFDGGFAYLDWRAALSKLSRMHRTGRSYLQEGFDTTAIDIFHSHLSSGVKPNRIHKVIAELARHHCSVPGIFTTNFDTLVEDTFNAYDLSYHIFDLHLQDGMPDPTMLVQARVIVKMHGTHYSTRAETSLDKALPLEDQKNLKNYFSKFSKPTIVFAGISLSDERLRSVFNLLCQKWKDDDDQHIIFIGYTPEDIAAATKEFKKVTDEIKMPCNKVQAVQLAAGDFIESLLVHVSNGLPPSARGSAFFGHHHPENLFPEENIVYEATLEIEDYLNEEGLNTTKSQILRSRYPLAFRDLPNAHHFNVEECRNHVESYIHKCPQFRVISSSSSGVFGLNRSMFGGIAYDAAIKVPGIDSAGIEEIIIAIQSSVVDEISRLYRDRGMSSARDLPLIMPNLHRILSAIAYSRTSFLRSQLTSSAFFECVNLFTRCGRGSFNDNDNLRLLVGDIFLSALINKKVLYVTKDQRYWSAYETRSSLRNYYGDAANRYKAPHPCRIHNNLSHWYAKIVRLTDSLDPLREAIYHCRNAISLAIDQLKILETPMSREDTQKLLGCFMSDSQRNVLNQSWSALLQHPQDVIVFRTLQIVCVNMRRVQRLLTRHGHLLPKEVPECERDHLSVYFGLLLTELHDTVEELNKLYNSKVIGFEGAPHIATLAYNAIARIVLGLVPGFQRLGSSRVFTLGKEGDIHENPSSPPRLLDVDTLNKLGLLIQGISCDVHQDVSDASARTLHELVLKAVDFAEDNATGLNNYQGAGVEGLPSERCIKWNVNHIRGYFDKLVFKYINSSSRHLVNDAPMIFNVIREWVHCLSRNGRNEYLKYWCVCASKGSQAPDGSVWFGRASCVVNNAIRLMNLYSPQNSAHWDENQFHLHINYALFLAYLNRPFEAAKRLGEARSYVDRLSSVNRAFFQGTYYLRAAETELVCIMNLMLNPDPYRGVSASRFVVVRSYLSRASRYIETSTQSKAYARRLCELYLRMNGMLNSKHPAVQAIEAEVDMVFGARFKEEISHLDNSVLLHSWLQFHAHEKAVHQVVWTP